MRYRAPVAAALFLAFIAGGCGGEANPVPDVEGKRLDVAEELLDDAGLGYEVIGGGDLGVIVRRNAGKSASSVPVPASGRSRSTSTSGGRASATSRTISTTTSTTTRTTMTTSDLSSRLDDFARRLAGLEQELRELRELAHAEPSPARQSRRRPRSPPPPPPPPAQSASGQAHGPGLERAPHERLALRPRRVPRRSSRPEGSRLGGRGRDAAGNRLLLRARGGPRLDRPGRARQPRRARFSSSSAPASGCTAPGPVHSALAATGAGIAGGYATLLAATALYDLVLREIALVLAAGIAVVATVTALAWASELIAGLGLIGAMLAPAAIALQDGEWSPIGTAFAAVMLPRRRSRSAPLGAVACGALLATIWQALGLALTGDVTDGRRCRRRSLLAPLLPRPPSRFRFASSAQLSDHSPRRSSSSARCWPGSRASLSSTAPTKGGSCSAPRSSRAWPRPLCSHARANAISARSSVPSPSGSERSRRDHPVRPRADRRLGGEQPHRLAGAAGQRAQVPGGRPCLPDRCLRAIFWEAPLDQLYTVTDSPADGVVAVIMALGAAIFAFYAKPWDSDERFGGIFVLVAPLLVAFRSAQPLWRSLAGWTSALAALYAASLGILELAERIARTIPRLSTGATSASRASGALLRSSCSSSGTGSRREIRLGGIAWLGAVLLEAVLFDLHLDGDPRATPPWSPPRPSGSGIDRQACRTQGASLPVRCRVRGRQHRARGRWRGPPRPEIGRTTGCSGGRPLRGRRRGRPPSRS